MPPAKYMNAKKCDSGTLSQNKLLQMNLVELSRGSYPLATCSCVFSNATGETTPLAYGLELAYTNKLPDEQKAAVKELAFQMFGGRKGWVKQ